MYHKPIHHPLSSSSSQLCPIILQTNAYSMWMEITNRINGWNRKETLIKSIVEAVPTLPIVFKIPINICKGMTDAMSQFWWGDDDDKKRICWQAWWKLCSPKNYGGMGFRDFHSFNLAMLAKQVRRVLCDPNSLCARVLRAKYYPDGKLLRAKMRSGSSFTWQSMLAGLDCFKRGYIWRVGDGTQINIWRDNWIPGSRNTKVLTLRGTL